MHREKLHILHVTNELSLVKENGKYLTKRERFQEEYVSLQSQKVYPWKKKKEYWKEKERRGWWILGSSRERVWGWVRSREIAFWLQTTGEGGRANDMQRQGYIIA